MNVLLCARGGTGINRVLFRAMSNILMCTLIGDNKEEIKIKKGITLHFQYRLNYLLVLILFLLQLKWKNMSFEISDSNIIPNGN